ncbi:MAG: hypothetical protein HN458_06075 [Euryarchaeota archaeon]|jgi:hypothetical protein|nr:hypothetical protein [Euryarchaeota archaeon]
MENLFARQDDWDLGTIFWYAVVVWFSSSLLSQALYMALYGVPYDAVVLLKQFGPAYYVVFAIELFIWIGIGSLVVMKFVRKLSSTSPQSMSTA